MFCSFAFVLVYISLMESKRYFVNKNTSFGSSGIGVLWHPENKIWSILLEEQSQCPWISFTSPTELKSSSPNVYLPGPSLIWLSKLQQSRVQKSYHHCWFFFKGPRDLGQYKSSEWLLEKLSIRKLFPQTWQRQPKLYDYSCEKDSWGIAMSKV